MTTLPAQAGTSDASKEAEGKKDAARLPRRLYERAQRRDVEGTSLHSNNAWER